jgi:hypothetical protein
MKRPFLLFKRGRYTSREPGPHCPVQGSSGNSTTRQQRLTSHGVRRRSAALGLNLGAKGVTQHICFALLSVN